jgi:23S rRNA pseudouridine1911/1915/1917 synthase
LLYHCKENLPTINGTERPWIVHRLDKDTSWVIMVAKNDIMMKYLQEIIKKRKIQKYYLTIVKWKIKEKKFSIESYIGRHPTDKIKMTTKNPLNPKIAYTSWELLTYIDDEFSLLKIKIETGRTHQIRVHLASIGFPILWDKVYGDKEVNIRVEKKYGIKRQALHAYELTFELYGEKRGFIAPIKKDMEKIISNIEYRF